MKKKIIIAVSCLLAVAVTCISILSFKQNKEVVKEVAYAKTFRDAKSFGYMFDTDYGLDVFEDADGFKSYMKSNNQFIVPLAGLIKDGVSLVELDYTNIFNFDGCDCGVWFFVDDLSSEHKEESVKIIADYMNAHKGVYNYPVFILVDSLCDSDEPENVKQRKIIDALVFWYNYLTAEENGKIYPVFLFDSGVKYLEGVALSDMDINYSGTQDIEGNLDEEVEEEYSFLSGNVVVSGVYKDSQYIKQRRALFQLACFKDYPKIIKEGGYNGFEKKELADEFTVTYDIHPGITLRNISHESQSVDRSVTYIVEKYGAIVFQYELKYGYELYQVIAKPVDPSFKSEAIIDVHRYGSNGAIEIYGLDCDYELIVTAHMKFPDVNFFYSN